MFALRPRFARTAAAVCALMAAACGFAETEWSIHTWQTDDGLPNNNVTGIAPTADGFLWVGTLSKPARFDGASFEAFPPKRLLNGLTQKISAVHRSVRGLWLGTDRGHVALLRGDRIDVFGDGLPERVVQTLTEDAAGALWIVYRAGVVCRLKEGTVRQFTAGDGLPSGYTASLAVDAHGTLHFGKTGRIGVVIEDRFVTLHELPRVTTRIAARRGGGIWICCGRRFFQWSGDTLTDLGAFEPEHADAEPTAIIEDARGGVWIGTSDSGLFHYANGKFEPVPVSHRGISSLAEDEEGNVWVGTDGGGLNRVRPRAVSLETAATGLPFETLQSLTEDSSGTIWAATQNGLVIRRQGETWETFSARPDWPGGRASCIAADRLGGVWIATRDRMLHYWRAGRFQTWRPGAEFAGRTVHAIVVARNGDVWLGVQTPDLLQRVRDGKFTTFPAPPGIRIIRALAEDRDGVIWAGTSQGTLLRIENERLTNETEKIRGPDGFRSIRHLHATPDGALWIAYADEGLGIARDGRFAQITSAQGLPDDSLSQIIADDHGWLWIGGNRGIFRARQDDLEAFAWGRMSQLRVIHYGQSQGLRSLQANFGDTPGALRTRDGRIWMPMRTALAVVNPDNLAEDAQPPRVLLTRVAVNDQPLAWFGGVVPVGELRDLKGSPERLELAPDHRRVEFEFTALSFAAPDNVRFRYWLEGFDDGWVEGGRQRRVTYPRLPHGDYRFRVKACNSNGIWNETGASIAFTVRPFFWQTWWFRLAACGLVLSGVVGGVRYVSFRRLRRRLDLLERQAALDRERTRIARDIHDDLGSRLTQATLLVELAQHAPPEKTPEHMHQVATTVREVSESLDEIIWAVNPRNDVFPRLVHYVTQFAVDFLNTADIRCRVDLPDTLPTRAISPEVRHHLLLVAKEALTNIARHARATEVWLRVTLTADGFQLRVEDNGRGCQRSPDDLHADGLRNMRQRLAEIGGEFHLSTGETTGTRIMLSLSWARAAAGLQLDATAPQTLC